VLRGIASGTAPALVGRDLDGHAVSLRGSSGQARDGALLGDVVPGLPGRERIDRRALARDHAVVTVATNSGQADAIRAAMAGRGVRFPVVVDAEGEIARAWGVSRFPTSFFVGSDRRIRNAASGFMTGAGLRARLWLAGL
jgi:hypothetical protein